MSAEALRSALLGFLVCTAVSCLLFAVLYFGAPYQAEKHVAGLIKTFGETEADARAYLIEDARWVASGCLKNLLIFFAIYWSITGILSKLAILRSRVANLLLFLGCVGIVTAWLNRYFGWANAQCDFIPYPQQGFQFLKIYECPSSHIFFSGLTNVSTLLFLVSLIVRVVNSRMRAKTAL